MKPRRYTSIAQGIAIEALLNSRPPQRSTTMSAPIRPFCIYRNPETSDLSREYPTLQEALGSTPSPGAQIVQNGTKMAYVRVIDETTIISSLLWTLTPAGRAAL